VERSLGTRSWGERWVRRFAPRLLSVTGIRDSVSGFAALRLAVLRQATQRAGGATGPLLTTEGWCANAELLARLTPHARRIETVATSARYDLQQRPSRLTPWHQLVAAWRGRGVVRAARSAAVALALLAAPLALDGQDSAHASLPAAATVAAVPFPVGERLTYGAKYGIFSVGTAMMEVMGIDTLRGIETVHMQFRISGGALWYHLDQTLESWVGRHDFQSRRFRSVQDERDRHRERTYEIFPDSGFYREAGRDTTFATVAQPLDDAAFLYWVRTLPLEIGKRYEYARYFRPDRNPVIIEVLGRERVSVAGKKWNAIVVRPKIPQGRGIFSERSETRIWLSDDARRLVLAIQSNFSFGQVTLKLKELSVPEQP
jgi:hypothetical protein